VNWVSVPIFVIPAQSPGLAKAGPGLCAGMTKLEVGMTKLEIGKLIRDYSLITGRAHCREHSMSSLSLAMLAALLGGSPSLKVVHRTEDPLRVYVVAELSADQVAELPEGTLSRKAGRQVLTFSLLNAEGKPGSPMLGDYQQKGSQLTFSPRFRLTAGSTYAGRLHSATSDTLTVNHHAPTSRRQSMANVTDVFPSTDTLPANSLQFYIHFDQPMREGRAIFERIHLLDEEGKKVLDPWRRTELWTEDARRFTLWIHPGRVKQGVNLREEFGPVLHPGRKYTLLIEQGVQSQNGRPLEAAYQKEFRTVPDDRSRPLPQNWKLTPPRAGSRMPLRLEFGEPLDHALALRCIEVRTAQGQQLTCSITLQDDDSVALLTPPVPWLEADHLLIVDPILEDLSGNTPERIFDTDLTMKNGHQPQLQLPFRPRLPSS
jgi:hypothetical protein